MCDVPLVRVVCRECYNDPPAVYEKLKRLGMDLVTITDHDSIGAAEALRSRPDFFLSEEVTCTLPSGTQLHAGVYDITERDHIEIQRRRTDFASLAAYLHQRERFFSANHVFSSLTGRREPSDFPLFESAFPGIETRNGHMLALANRAAAALAQFTGKAEVGGSDAHAMASIGCVYTEVPGAYTMADYLEGLGLGRGVVRGALSPVSGSYWKLTSTVYSIAFGMLREAPAAALLAPLLLAVPLVTLGNLVRELTFGRWWSARYLRSVARRIEEAAAARAEEAA